MKLVHPVISVHTPNYRQSLETVMSAGSLCYDKKLNAGMETAEMEDFIKARLDAGHESLIEHVSISVLITTSRQVTHELVRHRLCSFTQSSTRFIDSSKESGGHITIVIPPWFNFEPDTYELSDMGLIGSVRDMFNEDAPAKYVWLNTCLIAERAYRLLRRQKMPPELCANIIQNNKAAMIYMTANAREWRHILALRAKGTTGRPHPQMRQIMYPIWHILHDRMPVFFDKPDKTLSDIPGALNVIRTDNLRRETDVVCHKHIGNPFQS